MALKSFKLNRAGVRALLRSQMVADDLRARAEERCPEGCAVDVRVGRNRVVVYIKTETKAAYWDERKNHTLSEAISR